MFLNKSVMFCSYKTYILVRILLASILLVVLEVLALDLVVLGFDFGFFVVDFLGRLGLGLALLGFGSCSRSR